MIPFKLLPQRLLVTVVFFFLVKASFAQVVINEFSAANLSLTVDNYQKYEDWVELYNTSTQPVDIGDWLLSDDKAKPEKWAFPTGTIIPAEGFLLIWCSGRNEVSGGNYHASFKLTQTKKTAEIITLTKANGVTADFKKVRTTMLSQSVGRKTDGGADWGICTLPTPNSSNIYASYREDFAKTPVMDLEPGFYPGSIMVALSSEEPGVTIRYTKDGNEPTAGSLPYASPIAISTTTVLKARAFPTDSTLLPSFTAFNTYFINVDHTLPVVSVAGYQLLTLANGNQGLRPFGSFEFFGLDKTRSAQVTGEFNSHGQDSWVNSQRSIDFVSRDEMGINSAIKEVLYPGLSDRDEFQRVILRAAGDDNYPGGSGWTYQGQVIAAHMRDAYTQNLAVRGGMHVDSRTASKAIIYMNGKYWGVYDLRELPDDHDYTDYYYGQGKYDLQYLLTWGNTWAQYYQDSEAATKMEWDLLVNYILTNNMAVEENFLAVKGELDYKSLVDYMIVNSFANASDWLNYNTGWWRGLNPEGGHQKWGYILWDLDATYAYYINYTGILDTSATAPSCNVEEIDLNNWGDHYPQSHLDILNKLRENPEFNQYWITRQADMSKTVFGCENMLGYLDEVEASIDPEMTKHIAKWGGTYAKWKSNVARLRDFIERRCEYLPNGLKDCYQLEGPYQTVFRVEPSWGGSIQANTLVFDPAQLPVTTPIFGGIDLRLEATPAGGFIFDHWESKAHTIPNPSQLVNQLALTGPDTIIAYFTGTSAVNNPVGKPQYTVSVFPTLVKEGFSITYDLPVTTPVTIRLLDIAGHEVTKLATPANAQQAGPHRLTFNAVSMPPGSYFVQFLANTGFEKTIKIVVLPK
jgi:hypothetical protein